MPRGASGRPEIESLELERFQVYSRVEILSLLRSLQKQRVLVTLYFNRGEDFLLTSLLTVNPEFEELVFDAGPDRERNARLLESSRITCVAFVDNVKIQFGSGRAEATTFDRQPAFRIRLPDSVLRLQRRNFFRVYLPITKPLRAHVADPAAPGTSVEIAVVDMACGGVGVVLDPEKLRVEPGMKLEKFSVELPDVGMIACSLQVRHISDASKGIQKRFRLGCQMTDLPGPMATLVQRYVNKLERERLSMK